MMIKKKAKLNSFGYNEIKSYLKNYQIFVHFNNNKKKKQKDKKKLNISN